MTEEATQAPPGAAAETTTTTETTTQAPPDWRANLPEDLREHSALRDIKDVTGLAKGYVHAQKLVGMDRSQLLTVPGEDATPEERDAFFEKLGRPSDPKGYEFQIGDEQKDLVDEGTTEWYREVAHKHGLTTQQAKGIFEEYVQFAQSGNEKAQQALTQQREQGEAELRKEWGAAYETKLKAAAQVATDHFPEGFKDFLDQSGLGNHPMLTKGLAALADALGEDYVDASAKADGVMTPAQASEQITMKMADKTFMQQYMDKSNPAHAAAVRTMEKLHRMAAGR